MTHPAESADIRRLRRELLVVLKMVYPAALQADQLLRSLLAVFPALEWHPFHRDLCYLVEKGYLQRVVAGSESDEILTPWRKRWFRITAVGLEVADRLVGDPALEP